MDELTANNNQIGCSDGPLLNHISHVAGGVTFRSKSSNMMVGIHRTVPETGLKSLSLFFQII